jgi:predicted PolB exonuclease-like 3'-5' exonuclease
MAQKIEIKSAKTSPEILMLGYICIKDVETLPEKLGILDRFGLSDSDIATICNCAVQSIRDARQKLKKRSGRG